MYYDIAAYSVYSAALFHDIATYSVYDSVGSNANRATLHAVLFLCGLRREAQAKLVQATPLAYVRRVRLTVGLSA